MGKRITVSDHALVRYIERVHGIDIDQLREIVADLVREAAEVGATKFSVDGFTYAIAHQRIGNEAVVTTVLPGASPTMANLWRGKRRAVEASP